MEPIKPQYNKTRQVCALKKHWRLMAETTFQGRLAGPYPKGKNIGKSSEKHGQDLTGLDGTD